MMFYRFDATGLEVVLMGFLKQDHYRHTSGCFHTTTALLLLTGVLMGISVIWEYPRKNYLNGAADQQGSTCPQSYHVRFFTGCQRGHKISKITGSPGMDS